MTPLNDKINLILNRNITGVRRIPFLTELLSISKESAYRRLRNEVSYTMDEIYILSTKLNFSVDDIFSEMSNIRIEKSLSPLNVQNLSPADNYVKMMKSTINAFSIIEDNEEIEAFYVGNKIPNGILLNFPLLTKLRYVRWIHQTHNLPISSKFSDIIIPSQVENINQEYLGLSKAISKFTMIFDENVILAIINTIKFYYRRNLISEDELIKMKNELLLLIRRLGDILGTGKNKDEHECFVYLSDLNIESNIMLLKFNRGTSVHLLSSGKNPIVLTNTKMYEEQRLWVNSILKFSVLITCSNELLQAEFINKQYNLIESQFTDLLSEGMIYH